MTKRRRKNKPRPNPRVLNSNVNATPNMVENDKDVFEPDKRNIILPEVQKVHQCQFKTIEEQFNYSLKDFLIFPIEALVNLFLWAFLLCTAAILLTTISQKNSQGTVEMLYFQSPLYGFIAGIYFISLLIIWSLKEKNNRFQNIFEGQVKQFYFAVPILASLMFLAIDRVN